MSDTTTPADQSFESSGLSFATHGDLVVVLHAKQNPTDAEWQRYIEVANARAKKSMCTLVFTDGGAPAAGQRGPLMSIFKGLQAPVAVVSDLAAIRFVASSMSLLGLRIKSFSADGWRGSFDHFGMAAAARVACERRLTELRKAGFAKHVVTWTRAIPSP